MIKSRSSGRKKNVWFFTDSWGMNSIFWILLMITHWKIKIFVSNYSHSISLVSLYNTTIKTYFFRCKIFFNLRRNVDFRASTRYLPMIDDNSLKTRHIRYKLFAYENIRLTLQVNQKTCIFCWKITFILKKCRFLSLSTTKSKKRRLYRHSSTEHDIWIWSTITHWKFKIFVSNLLHSIEFV